MEQTEALQRMTEIKRIMERTTLYTLLPGKASVVGGVLALIGCGVSYLMLRSHDIGGLVELPYRTQFFFCLLWVLIGAAAVIQEVVLAARAARESGVSPLSRPGRFAALSLTPSVIVGMVITIKVVIDIETGATGPQPLRYLVPIWIMCYGTGVYAAGLFSVRLPRLLGGAFIMTGIAGLLYFDRYGLVLLALSFGLMHIAFGLDVLRRSRRSGGA